MRTSGRLLVGSLVITFAGGLGQNALAAEAIMLRAGEATGPNAIFAFEKAKPHRIVVRTTQVGVAGSRIEVFVDKAKAPAFRHLLRQANANSAIAAASARRSSRRPTPLTRPSSLSSNTVVSPG